MIIVTETDWKVESYGGLAHFFLNYYSSIYVRTTACAYTSISLNIISEVINIGHPLQCNVFFGGGTVIHTTATWYAPPIQTPFADQEVWVVFQGIVLQWQSGNLLKLDG